MEIESHIQGNASEAPILVVGVTVAVIAAPVIVDGPGIVIWRCGSLHFPIKIRLLNRRGLITHYRENVYSPLRLHTVRMKGDKLSCVSTAWTSRKPKRAVRSVYSFRGDALDQFV